MLPFYSSYIQNNDLIQPNTSLHLQQIILFVNPEYWCKAVHVQADIYFEEFSVKPLKVVYNRP